MLSLYCFVKYSTHTHVMTNVGLSRKLKRHHYFLERLNETPFKVWKCMDQQCSAI